MAPGDLQEVLEALKPVGRSQPDLLIGLGAADDAAVWRITPEVAIVETVDFFPPVVDDPRTWGAVSDAATGSACRRPSGPAGSRLPPRAAPPAPRWSRAPWRACSG